MSPEGVSAYLMLVDPATLVIEWANQNVEREIVGRMGRSAVGLNVADVVYLGKEVGVIDCCRRVSDTGETKHLTTKTFSATGDGSTTNGSFYRLPDGKLLIASEWIVDAERASADQAV